MSEPNPASSSRSGTAVPPARGPVSASGAPSAWQLRDHRIPLDEPVVMGIVNLTPDSFSDGGAYPSVDAALSAADAMVRAGAAILDVGGESTRPGAARVASADEIARVVPFLREAVSALEVPLSVDTRKADVAKAALAAGASCVNDVSGLRFDPAMAGTVARSGAGLVLMHMRGQPANMGELTDYEYVTRDVLAELGASLDLALSAGVSRARVAVDPGIGFAKTPAQSLTLIRDLPILLEIGYPVLVGPSRKSFLGAVLGLPTGERLEGTIAACVAAYLGGARIFRVHDVGPVVRALRVAHAICHPEALA